MKKILISFIAFVLCMNVPIIHAQENAVTEVGEMLVVDDNGDVVTFLEYLNDDNMTRGATDEYYQQQSLTFTSSEYFSHTETASKFFNALDEVVALATVADLLGIITLYPSFSVLYTYSYKVLQQSKVYNQVTNYYARKATITFKVYDAVGNYLRTATYTNVTVITRYVISYF